jgi:hypothetical protein
MTTEQTELAIAQYRKRAFTRAGLTIRCLKEKNGNMKDCTFDCKSYRICREVLETI